MVSTLSARNLPLASRRISWLASSAMAGASGGLMPRQSLGGLDVLRYEDVGGFTTPEWQVGRLPYFTLYGDGRVVLILDVAALFEAKRQALPHGRSELAPATESSSTSTPSSLIDCPRLIGFSRDASTIRMRSTQKSVHGGPARADRAEFL